MKDGWGMFSKEKSTSCAEEIALVRHANSAYILNDKTLSHYAIADIPHGPKFVQVHIIATKSIILMPIISGSAMKGWRLQHLTIPR